MALDFEKSIEVTVSKKGEVKVEAKGYDDGGCLKATQSVEEALGKLKKRTNKAEMAKMPDLKEKVKIGI
jgi:hypothetical protein